MAPTDPTRWLQHAAAMTQAAIVVHAPDTSILYANRRAAEILGIEHDTLTGRTATDPSFALLDADGELLPLERFPVVLALHGEQVKDCVVGIRHEGASRPTWGRLSAEPAYEEGELVAIVVTFVDDTELQEARQALADSEERFAIAVSGTRDGLWDVDLRTGQAWYAPRFEALLGLEQGALEGRTDLWQAFVHPEDRDRVLATFEDHLAGQVPYDLRYRLRHADGGWRHVHARGRAIRDEAGVPVRLSGAITDVTDEVRAEEERLAARERLEATARLEGLSVLAGGVAHDFNNLLMGILGAVDTAEMQLDEASEVREQLDLVVRGAERAAELTRQLLAYAGRAAIDTERIDPAGLVDELARLVRGSLPSGARLEVVTAAATPAVDVDATQLRQVVMNLLVNGGQAVDEGGLVRVSTGEAHWSAEQLATARLCYAEPGRFSVIEVQDDGRGMDASTLSRIFEPFFTTKESGHGLGLAAVHGLVRTHEGFVDVTSAPGQGTRFVLGLPAAEAAADTEEATRPERPSWKGQRALIVDDEPLVRTVIERMLGALGFEVAAVPSAEAAREAITSTDPDVVVLDITLGGGTSGIHFLRELRARGDHRPVLMCSGHIEHEQRLALDGEPTVFLGKPFRLHTLVERLQRLL